MQIQSAGKSGICLGCRRKGCSCHFECHTCFKTDLQRTIYCHGCRWWRCEPCHSTKHVCLKPHFQCYHCKQYTYNPENWQWCIDCSDLICPTCDRTCNNEKDIYKSHQPPPRGTFVVDGKNITDSTVPFTGRMRPIELSTINIREINLNPQGVKRKDQEITRRRPKNVVEASKNKKSKFEKEQIIVKSSKSSSKSSSRSSLNPYAPVFIPQTL